MVLARFLYISFAMQASQKWRNFILNKGPLWLWSYGSWIYNYLCNQCLSPLMLWVRISIRVRCTTLCDKVCQWLATGHWFSPGPPVFSNNKTDHHDITEILLKVALNTIKQTYSKQCIKKIIFTPNKGNCNQIWNKAQKDYTKWKIQVYTTSYHRVW